MSDTIGTVEMSPEQSQWFAGVAAGARVTDEHASTEFPDEDTRVKLWWFYVGVLAGEQAKEHGWQHLEQFLLGASLRQPTNDQTVSTDQHTDPSAPTERAPR